MLDAKEREDVRRGLRVLVEEAPLAPEYEAIITPRLGDAHPAGRSPLVVLVASGLLVIAIGGLTFLFSGSQGGPGPSAPALDSTPEPLPALSLGEFPRVSIDLPGWTISYVEESEGSIEMSDVEDTALEGMVFEESVNYHSATILFTDGTKEAELRLSSSALDDVERLIADRLSSGSRLTDETVLGSKAAVIRVGDLSFTAIWSASDVEYEFVGHEFGGEDGEETFRSVLRALRRVGETEWTASLSDEIVSDRASTVRQYLSDIPLPPGFDTTPVEEGPIEHWYQVGADTVRAVACGWLDHWVSAKAAGDEASMQQAVDAMVGSRQWSILVDMSAEGGFHETVWEYADAIATDGTVSGGYESAEVLAVESSYTNAFGCNTS
jgi:hypothetical protein